MDSKIKDSNRTPFSRRNFLQGIGVAATSLGTFPIQSAAEEQESAHQDTGDLPRDAHGNVIPGFGEPESDRGPDALDQSSTWEQKTDRKIRVGIAGYGLCKFGASFFYQNHPNVEVVAASDLDPTRCQQLAKTVGAKTTYASCEEMIKSNREIEAIYIATDAPSHARLSIMALEHEKHVVCAVPAVFGWDAEDQAEKLFAAVRRSGKKYMMNETSTFHAGLYANRRQYQAGALGKLIYTEGEYWHDGVGTLGSFNRKNGKIDAYGWRRGLPPMWYPTHATAYYVSVTGGGRLTEVSCVGTSSYYPVFQNRSNPYNNSFGTQIGLFKTSEGGTARMGVSWDMKNAHGEKGRCYGQKPGDKKVNIARPKLPPGVLGGGHGGSHGQLTNNFIEAVLFDRKPIVDVAEALNMTMSGIIAHQSALKDGEWMKIPQYEF